MKDLPFYLSLDNQLLQVIGGAFEKKVFKVSSFASGKVPLDILQRGEIVQPQLAAEIINQLSIAAKPTKIKSNFCYFSIPDEFVFTKFLTIPRIEEKELKTTLFFKIKDFLPHKPEEMCLDWQLLADHGQKFEVSVAAVRKEIIDSYLATCKILNIFPLGFEPESYSLASLAALSSPDPALMIYFNTHKVIFCYAENEIVLLTTTFHFDGKPKNQEILDELAKSARFWQAGFGQTKKIKNVYLAGHVCDELVIKQAVKNNFSITVQRLPIPVIIPPLISADKLADLTSLFGLAFSQRKREKEQKKVTLIPTQVKEERKLFKFKKQVKSALKLTIFILSFFIAIYSYVFLSIFFQLEQVEFALSGAEKMVFTKSQIDLEKRAINFNQKLISLDQVLKKRQSVSPLLLDFIDQIPAGVVINQFSFEPSSRVIEIQGEAKKRQDVLTLEKALSKLGEVSVPLSSFEKSEDSNFKALVKLKKN